MTIANLMLLESRLDSEVTRLRGLGGYSTDAPTLLLLTETVLFLTQEIIRQEKALNRQRRAVKRKR